jgi:hypothetical protein
MINKKLAEISDLLEEQAFEGEVYCVGNPESKHDIDLVIIYHSKPEEKFDADLDMICTIRAVFGEDTRIFQDCQFDNYTSKKSIHVLSYNDVIKEESPFLVKCFFEPYVSIYGDDNGEKYHNLANKKIKEESPHRAKQYINIAIKQIQHTITNPRDPLELLNSLISANHYACRTIQEVSKEYSLNQKIPELDTLHSTKNEIQGKLLSASKIENYTYEQKSASKDLLTKLWSIKRQLNGDNK